MGITGMIVSFVAVVVLAGIALAGVWGAGLEVLFGVVIPYLALATFFGGIVYRIVKWAKSPVPFRIPTTCGQEKSLSWIKPNRIDNPSSTGGVLARMALEIFCFRSLFRNTALDFREGPRLSYGSSKWLWVGALTFHYAFLVTMLRHLRFFTEPVPGFVHFLERLDGFLELGLPPLVNLPGLMISGQVLLLAVTYLFLRRLLLSQVRYISLLNDYFPLFLIIGIAATGTLMRYVLKVDIVRVKELSMGLVTFHPVVPEGVGSLFYVHLFLVCVLLAYFPFSKLMHMGGIFLSPTRNLANNNRMVRHINPWNYPVKTHSYEEYEEEFREKMVEAGIPVEKE